MKRFRWLIGGLRWYFAVSGGYGPAWPSYRQFNEVASTHVCPKEDK